jgi:hypothetical protein
MFAIRSRALWQQDRFVEAELSIPYGPSNTIGNRHSHAPRPSRDRGAGRRLPPVVAESLARSANRVGVGDVDQLVTRGSGQVEGVHADEAVDHRPLGRVRGDG